MVSGPVASADVTVAAGAGLADINHLSDPGFAGEIAIETDTAPGRWRASVAYLGEQTVTVGRYRSGNPVRGSISPFWVGGVQAVYRLPMGPGVIEMGAGLAGNTNAENVEYLLPSRLNANLTVSAEFGAWSLNLRHLSNVWTRDSNRGQNWLTVGYSF